MAKDLLLVLGVVLLCSLVLSEDFNPKKVNLIDRAGINWLFRGNEPKNSTNMFVYSELVSTMQQVALSQANTSLPSSFYLLDLSFESYEEEDKIIERAFFAENPHLGNFTDWVIIGDFTGPNEYPASVVKQRAMTLELWQLDKLPSRVVTLRNILNSPGPNNIPVVIYIHCEAGSDRTGEVSGAYYLTYLNFPSFEAAITLDNKIAGRPIRNASANALQWYCYYLQYAKNYTVECSS
eukprot:Phypoly_transcript_18346.p1 GENE.Phypoly_transcript_18346~~Phypoly_transcript_18346.p1  ORF type:complete len:249 (+),score=36.42 Phypoly_transcript_18346:37-747(+)